MMLRALAADLGAIARTQLVSLCDARLAGMLGDWEQRPVAEPAHWDTGFDALVRESDAVWLIAPETDRVLEQLSARVLAADKPLLGSRPHAIAIAASKLATADALRGAGVAVVPTGRPDAAAVTGPCVVKPDDGCGCEDTRKFAELSAARAWIAGQPRPERFVVQPYVAGDPISLSVLAAPKRVVLLSVNRQRIELCGDAFSFVGSVVNAIEDSAGELAQLAERTVAAIPGLWGHVGIDVVLTQPGPVVLEVNPRLTTSYAGLHAALGVNPAQLVIDLLDERTPVAWPVLGRRPVAVDLKQDL